MYSAFLCSHALLPLIIFCCAVVAVQFNVLSDRFMVQSNDVIGWTNEEDHSLISFNLDEHYNMRFSDIPQGGEFPSIDDTVIVSFFPYNAVFSVAVQIIPR